MAELAALRNQRQELQAERVIRSQKSAAGGGVGREANPDPDPDPNLPPNPSPNPTPNPYP